MVAGTSTIRTMVASTATATARPRPISFMARRSMRTKLPNTHTMIRAAAVISRAVTARPALTAWALSPVASHSSLTDESRKTS